MYVPKRQKDPLSDDDNRFMDDPGFNNVSVEDGWFPEEEAPDLLEGASNRHRMECAAEAYMQKAVNIMVSQSSKKLDREKFKVAVASHRDRKIGCLTLPFGIFFFLCFALSSQMHEDIANVFVVESGIRRHLGHKAEEVDSVAELWHWFNSTLFPRVFVQGDLQGVPFASKSSWSRVLDYNQLQGSLLISQWRTPAEPCTEDQGTTGNMRCYPAGSVSLDEFGKAPQAGWVPLVGPEDYAGGEVAQEAREVEWASAFSPYTYSGVRNGQEGWGSVRRLDQGRPEWQQRMVASTYDSAAFRAQFFANTKYSLLQDHLNYLHDRAWLDTQSLQVKVQALLLNAQVGRPRLEQFEATFVMSRAGGMFVLVRVYAIFLRTWAGVVGIVCDGVFAAALFVQTIVHLRFFCNAIRKRQFLKDAAALSSWVQLAIITGGWVCVACWLYQAFLTDAVVQKYEQVSSMQRGDVPPEHNTASFELHAAADAIAQFVAKATINSRSIAAWYHLLLIFSFFTAFRAQPRLGVVIDTLECTVSDILHSLIVLVPTFLAYAIAGQFAFGRRMPEFATPREAVATCFKYMMEGEYDWPTLSQKHYWTAVLWVWSFMVLVNVLMLNMVLAIVLDAYIVKRKVSGQSESIWVSFVHLVAHVVNIRRWVSDAKLLQGLQKLPRAFSVNDLRDEFNMCDVQVDIFLRIYRLHCKATLASEFQLKEAMKMAMAMKLNIDRVHEDVKDLRGGTGINQQQQKVAVPKDPVDEWLGAVVREFAAQNHVTLSLQWQLQQLRWQWQALEVIRQRPEAEPCANDPPNATLLTNGRVWKFKKPAAEHQ